MIIPRRLLVLLFAALTAGGHAAPSALRATCLRVESQVAPLAIAIPAPRFTWWLESARPGAAAVAHEVAVFTAPDAPGPLWSSGRQPTAPGPVEYAGPALQPGHDYLWRVRVWDEAHHESSWSEPGSFSTAPDLGTPLWIGAASLAERSPLLRHEFTVRPGLVRARACFSAVGYGELYLNGHKVGDALLEPAPTQYEKRVLYTAHEVTALLTPGVNAAGLWLNEGQAACTEVEPGRFHNRSRQYPGPYDAPRGWLRLDLTYADGSHETVTTDPTWQTSSSPLTYAHFYGGEDYDARLEQPGWATAGFDASRWTPAVVRPVTAQLSPSQLPPMRAVTVVRPVARRISAAGVYLFDLGQNVGGAWQIRVRGKPGTTVTVRGAETLDNRLFPGGFADAVGTSTGFTHGRGGHYERDALTRYTLKGGGEETYTPRFFYSGFQYIQVETTDVLALQSIELEALAIHTDAGQLGRFACSDPLLNQLYHNTVWSLKGVFQGGPMSNPNSEKYGWTGDAHFFGEAANAIFDLNTFWEKWLTDLRDSQALLGGGRLPSTVPNYRTDTTATTALWGAAYPLTAWYLYRHTGDARVYRENYEPVRAWAAYLASTAQDGLIGGIWGDHVAPGFNAAGQPVQFPATTNLTPLLGTAYYALTERVIAEMATVLGRPDDATAARARAAAAEARITRKYFDAAARRYEVAAEAPGHFPLQTANLVPLQLGFAPADARAAVLDAVLHDLRDTHHGHLMTGIAGTKALVKVLIRERQGDLLQQIATEPTYPGWGFWLAHGATTHWQHWSGAPDHNHAMFGSIAEFLVHGIAGITPPTEPGTTPGWDQVRLAPQILAKLVWADAAVPTPHGLLCSRWEKSPAGLLLDCTIPVGMTATLSLPGCPDYPLSSGPHRLLATRGQITRRP